MSSEPEQGLSECLSVGLWQGGAGFPAGLGIDARAVHRGGAGGRARHRRESILLLLAAAPVASFDLSDLLVLLLLLLMPLPPKPQPSNSQIIVLTHKLSQALRHFALVYVAEPVEEDEGPTIPTTIGATDLHRPAAVPACAMGVPSPDASGN